MSVAQSKPTSQPRARIPLDHALIGQAERIPTGPPTQVVSVCPVVLPTPTRLVDLQMRVSAPMTGTDLPIILLSHGHGFSNHLSSMNGYAPLANFWAAHGFVVIQPTHLSSKSLSFDADAPGAPYFWRSRVEDMKHILDNLDELENLVPIIKGRLDRTRIAVAGHSLGSHTAMILLGMQLIDDDNDSEVVDLVDPRIKAGVLLGAIGNGGSDLTPHIFDQHKFLRHLKFAEMKTPTLVVTCDDDVSPHLTTRGADWHADPYTLSTGPKSLVTLVGGGHILGGISGYDSRETGDSESPEHVAAVQRLTSAYLRSALYSEDYAWTAACRALESLDKLGSVEHK